MVEADTNGNDDRTTSATVAADDCASPRFTETGTTREEEPAVEEPLAT